uniref:Ras-associating domain-containing protein n=1 Tax=Strigamia maritima TaxID=126957 RepID=T1IZ35_STRMM
MVTMGLLQKCDISEFSTATISTAELRKEIENYNLTVATGDITLLEDGYSFSGFIRVHMRLCRPVNIYAVPRPPSIYDVLNDYSEGTADAKKTLTSFYLPRDTVKALHVTSETTTKDVIITLLNKFKVVDNPHKFALYERDYEIGESSKVRMRRIHDCEYPLRMILMWHNQGNTGRHLVLQENDTGDISWDAFSLPELNNFLTILKREEEDYLQQLRFKYSVMGEKLQQALQERDRLGAGEPSQQVAPQPPPRRRHSESLHLRGQLDASDSLQERLP